MYSRPYFSGDHDFDNQLCQVSGFSFEDLQTYVVELGFRFRLCGLTMYRLKVGMSFDTRGVKPCKTIV